MTEEIIEKIKDIAIKALATTSGTIKVKNLKEEVIVSRDKWGIPHIFAKNIDDLFFTQGYVHAQDRLWQMELVRRSVAGTLSEIFGEPLLDIDIYIRTIGLKRAAEVDTKLFLETADNHLKTIAAAYTEGVNAYIETHRNNLPLEFTLLEFQPSPWTITDIFSIGKYMAWSLGGNWSNELLRALLIAHLGEKRVRELFPFHPTEPAMIVPTGRYSDLASSLLTKQKKVNPIINADNPGAGSNNWVVDGHKSVTGNPLLANDPHLFIQMPSIWYELHLVGPDINVIGASLVGAPGVTIGHNEYIAWGFTNVGPDVQDLYVEKINPENPHQYLYQGNWENMQVLSEKFAVKGKEAPIVREVYITHHGPIINFMILGSAAPQVKWGLNETFALKWSGHQPSNNLIQAIIHLDKAKNWEEFRAALKLWDAPSQNVVYADIQGNIGYQMMYGYIPIRKKGQGLVPVPGWTGEYDWEGFIPFEELPSVFNPPTHFIATANQKIVADDYPYLISHDWSPNYRIRRITQLLTATEKLSREDFMKIQRDNFSLHAQELLPYLIRLSPKSERQRKALNYLKEWDLHLRSESIPGLIFEIWYQKLIQNLLKEKLGTELFDHYRWRAFHILAIPRILEYPTAFWVGESEDANNLEQRDKIVHQSLEQALEEISSKLGNDMSQWHWGKFHTMTFTHPLGTTPPLDQILNIGPLKTGGDGYTVNNSGFDITNGFSPAIIASYRQIIDLGDFSNSVAIHTTGQSGQPFSKHYNDFVNLWHTGKYHPMLFYRKDIEREEESRLILTPP